MCIRDSFRAVEKGLEIPENLDDLPDEDVKAEEKSEENTEMKTENIEEIGRAHV